MMLIGIYNTDLFIQSEPFTTPQLQFLLIFECHVDELPKKLRFEVTLPKQEPVGWDVVPPQNLHVQEGRSKFTLRHPFAIVNAVLRPGQIKARILYDEKEINLGGQWITLPEANVAATKPEA